MSRKHRRSAAPLEDDDLDAVRQDIRATVDRWKAREQREYDEQRATAALTPQEATAYTNSLIRGRSRRRSWDGMDNCLIPKCERPAIRLMDKPLGVCVGHGMDIATYFDVMVEDFTRDERKRNVIAMRRFLRIERERIEERAAATRKVTPGWIYYLLVADRIKIGYTVDVKRRLRSYPPGSPLLALHPGTKQLEGEMHAKFAGSRAAGREWFLDTPEIRDHIKEVITEFGEPDRARYEHHGTGRNKSRLKAS